MTNHGYGLADNYVKALKALDVNVLVGMDLNDDYQGDWVGLVQAGQYSDRYGLLVIGYGSCSGCDAWEAAENITEKLDVLRDVINRGKWFDSFDDAKAYIADQHERRQDWYPHEDNWPKFIAAVATTGEYDQERNLNAEAQS